MAEILAPDLIFFIYLMWALKIERQSVLVSWRSLNKKLNIANVVKKGGNLRTDLAITVRGTDHGPFLYSSCYLIDQSRLDIERWGKTASQVIILVFFKMKEFSSN